MAQLRSGQDERQPQSVATRHPPPGSRQANYGAFGRQSLELGPPGAGQTRKPLIGGFRLCVVAPDWAEVMASGARQD